MTVPNTPSLYIKKEKDIERTIDEPVTRSKPKNRFANVLFSLSLSLKEVRIFLKLIKTRKIDFETFKMAADELRQYVVKRPVDNKGGLFRTILEAKHNRALSVKEEQQSKQNLNDPILPSVEVGQLIMSAFKDKVLSPDGVAQLNISANTQFPQQEKENIATSWVNNMKKMFKL